MAQPNAGAIVAPPRLATQALHDFMRRKIEPIYVQHTLLRRMKQAGRVTGNHGGDYMEMRPRKRRRTIRGGSGNTLRVSFVQTNVHDVSILPWRCYDLAESQTQYEEMALAPQVNRFFEKTMKLAAECTEDFMEDLPTKMWADGGANATDMHGFQSWNASTGALISGSNLAAPSDTYAGKSTVLGTGGSWTGNYPQGVGTREYHHWSPFLVDYNSATLGGTTYNWKNQWQHAINYALIYMLKLQNIKPDVAMIDAELLRQAQDSLIGTQQIQVVSSASARDPATTRLDYNGIELGTEYGIPAATGWLIPVSKVELRHFGNQLIHVKEQFDIRTAEHLMLFRFFGNMAFDSPAYFAELLAISAGS